MYELRARALCHAQCSRFLWLWLLLGGSLHERSGIAFAFSRKQLAVSGSRCAPPVTVCRQALAATQCDLSCKLPPRLARAELGSAGLPARQATDDGMDTECDDVEITRDVSRINKEVVMCNKAALDSVHARAGASCRPMRYPEIAPGTRVSGC